MLVLKVFRGELITASLTAWGTSAAAATPTPPVPATATAAAALFARPGFVDLEVTAVQRLVGQPADRRLGAFIGGHRYKCKSPGTAAHAVGDQIHFSHRAEFFEEVLQIV